MLLIIATAYLGGMARIAPNVLYVSDKKVAWNAVANDEFGFSAEILASLLSGP